MRADLSDVGIDVGEVIRNPAPAKLYEEALQHEAGTKIAASGAMVARSGERTGRSPRDKRIVEHPSSAGEIWWGEINIPLSGEAFDINRERALDYLNTRERLFVIDGYAGWDPASRLRVRVVCERAYHALFMHNMLIRPTVSELAAFGEPDLAIYNAGRFPANRYTRGVGSRTSVDLSLERGEMVILGTQYAGEMKKGLFTFMNYLLPRQGILSMHCAATEGAEGDVSLLFGLSGTGKTTLSADPGRALIGDDEHGWSDRGVFNIEGGCYAKVIDLSPEKEPDIFRCIRFGAILENVVLEEHTRFVDYSDTSITSNTRAAYPIDFVEGAKQPCTGGHPANVIFLTCDAFGVLPPVSRLTPEQAMYHFVNGYTAKVPGTEVGIAEPVATFSACFGAPFLVYPPGVYARMLAERLRRHEARAWLVNTGWTGGPYGEGRRIDLPHTRAILDGIHEGSLARAEAAAEPVFGLSVPTACRDVPSEILRPRDTWRDPAAYDARAADLADRFARNFESYADQVPEGVGAAGPPFRA